MIKRDSFKKLFNIQKLVHVIYSNYQNESRNNI
jgi:hypothetical protein